MRRGVIAFIAAVLPAQARQVCPFEAPSLESRVAAEVAWAAGLGEGSAEDHAARLRKALALWRTVDSDAGRQVVVHLLRGLQIADARLTAAELELPGNEWARIARIPLLARIDDAGVLFREFRSTPLTDPAWELLGEALCKLEHPAFVAELFTSWRPVLRVIVTESPWLREERFPRPATKEVPVESVELDDFPHLPHCTWSRHGVRGTVLVMWGAGRGRRTSLVLTEADVEFARCRWLGILHRHSYPNAYARSFGLRTHQRDHCEFGARVAAARAEAEKGMRELATELVARRQLPESRAVPPRLRVIVQDERSEVTQKQYPLPKVD